MPSLPRPGDRLAGFRIERELGHGTTGVVYLAHQEALDRRVALKVVGRPLADDAAFRERFRHEARAVAGLDHPNVVQILETGEDDAHLWLAMRLVDGPDLRVLLRRTGRLEPEQAVVVVEQVAAALDAAHAAGLVHRDVKPGNVLIEDGPGRDLHVELADFGLARAPGIGDAAEGTPGYAAPEQLAGEEAGPAADVFGLGCVLYELLTGAAPPNPAPAPDPDVPWRRGPAAAAGSEADPGTEESATAGAATGSWIDDGTAWLDDPEDGPEGAGATTDGDGTAPEGGSPDGGVVSGPGGSSPGDGPEGASGGPSGPRSEDPVVGGAVAAPTPVGPAPTDPAAVAARAALLPLTPSVALPRLGGAFDPAVERATAADPAARFASAGEFAMWARAALSVPRASPDPVDPVRVAAATPASPAEVGPADPTWEIPRSPRRRRGRKLLVAAFLTLVLAVLGAAFAFIGSLGDSSRDLQAGTSPGAPAPTGGAAGGGAGSVGSSAGGPGPGSGAAAGPGSTGGGGTSGGGAAGGSGTAGGGGAGGGSGAGSSTGGSGSGASGGAGGTAAGPDAGRASGAGTPRQDGSSAGAGPGSSNRAGQGSGGSGSPRSDGGAGGATGASDPGSGSGAPGPGGGVSSGLGTSAGSVPEAGRGAPKGASTVALPPVPEGHVRFGGGVWVLDLPAAEGWRQTATQELDGGTRLVTRLRRPDAVRLVVEALPGRTAVVAAPGARPFPVRLPEAGRTDGALYRGGRFAMCQAGVCAALPVNGPNGGALVIVSAKRTAGAKRVLRRAAAGLRVR